MEKFSKQREMFCLVKELCGQSNILTIPRVLIRFTNSVDAALLLSQIIYWSDRNTSGEWFYKSYKDWFDEIGLSKHKVGRAAAILASQKLIKTKVKKANGNPTLHYLFDEDAFIHWLVKKTENESSKNGNPLKTKITTKTTKKEHVSFSDPFELLTDLEKEQARKEAFAKCEQQMIEKDIREDQQKLSSQ
jgi:hypothetical protein